MEINAKNLKLFRRDFNKAMLSLEQKYDVAIELGALRYDPIDQFFRGKIEAYSDAGPHTTQAAGISREQAKFERECRAVGATPDMYGKRFTVQGSEFTLTGVKPRGKKYKFIGTGKRGGRYKFTRNILQQLVD